MRPAFLGLNALLLLALLIPLPAASQVFLHWDNCSAGAATHEKYWQCNSQFGPPFDVIGSVIPPPGITRFTGIHAVLHVHRHDWSERSQWW